MSALSSVVVLFSVRRCVLVSLGVAELVAGAALAAGAGDAALERAFATVTSHLSEEGFAELAGKLIAERAVKEGVKDVVFDRGGYIFHGRVKALAEAAREGGLNF